MFGVTSGTHLPVKIVAMFLIFLHFRVSASKGVVDSPASELLFWVTNVSGPEKAGVITDSKMVVSLLTLRFDTSLHFIFNY